MSNNLPNIPKHVAIIPDGNRRWAKKRGLKPWMGHQKGATCFEKVIEKAIELKIPYITFWGSSWDNLTKRSKIEIKFLYKVYTNQFKKILTDERIHKNKVRVSAFGRWQEILPEETKRIIEKAIENTKNYNQYFLNFLLAYNGTDEMVECINKIVNGYQKNPITLRVTEGIIKENLWTKELPPVDLVIRTGCESDPHNSAGFMMWHIAYSQFHFTKTLFPLFGPQEFEKIIKDYSKRGRRFGA